MAPPPLLDPSLPNNSSSSSSSASAASSNRRLRISDVLASPVDEDDPFLIHRPAMGTAEGNFLHGRNRTTTSYHCSSPCRVLSRWLSWMRRAKTKRISAKCSTIKNGSEAGVEERNDSAVVMQPRCSAKGLNEGFSDENGDSSRIEVSFNAGIGCYLLYLVAATRNELDRINAARVEMETLLQNTKRQRRSADRDDDILIDFSNGKSKEQELEPQVSTEIHLNSYALPASSGSQESVNCEIAKREECLEDMEHLEVELEAELQLLQLQLDRDKLMERSQLQRVRNKDSTTSSRSYSMISSSSEEEVINFPEQTEADHSSFSPYELERKLHEVLESRQEEQIRELEGALECMKQKLEVKEMEVSWWKAAAARNGGMLSTQKVVTRGGQAPETEVLLAPSQQSWCKQ
ncbi:Protein POLAR LOCALIZATION DURING ASYMMETRIC DIVISION AND REDISTRIBUTION [Linum perenne]